MKPIEQVNIRWARTVVPIPLAEVDLELAAKGPSILFAPKAERTFLERVAAWKAMNTKRLRERDGEHIQVELQAFSIGQQFAFVSLPHEVFVELGMMIRQQSPFPVTAVVSMAQDVVCYVPTKKAFAEGSYEVTNSSFTPGGGETMANAAIDLLKGLTDQR